MAPTDGDAASSDGKKPSRRMRVFLVVSGTLAVLVAAVEAGGPSDVP